MDSKGIPGTAARSCSPPPHHHPPLPFSSVSNFSPLSGWRQAGPLRAFKRLLKVLVRHGPYPSTATHTIHPSLPTKPSKQSQLLSLRMSASITNSPYAGGQGSPMQENWGKKKKMKALACSSQRESLVLSATLTMEGLFQDCDVRRAWAMNDGENNALIHVLV